jgi:Rrf2 family nitric oxide-sensitive transcriptional repressor
MMTLGAASRHGTQGKVQSHMRLTVYSDYALRLLMFLSVRGDKLATIPQIADAYGISSNHLMKVVHQLGQAGFIETTRGRGGGMRLAMKPAEIVLGRVIRFTEPDMNIVPCFSLDNQDCPLRRACRLKAALQRAEGAFLDVLDEYTLADLTENAPSLRLSLGISIPTAPA